MKHNLISIEVFLTVTLHQFSILTICLLSLTGQTNKTWKPSSTTLSENGEHQTEMYLDFLKMSQILYSIGDPNLVISGFCRKGGEICAILVCYTAYSHNPVPTFQDNLRVPSSMPKNPSRWDRQIVPKHCMLHNIPEKHTSSKPYLQATDLNLFQGWDTLSSHHVSSCDITRASWDVRGSLTLNSMTRIHSSLTPLLTSQLARIISHELM